MTTDSKELNNKNYYDEGMEHYEKNEYDKAIECFTRIIELETDNELAYYNRGQAYHKKQEYDKAIKDYTKVIELKPNNVLAYNNRGIAHNYKHEYDEAIVDCTKAIELEADFSLAYSNRGAAYNGKQEYEKAIVDCTKAIELEANNVKAYGNRGVAYQGKQEYDKAIAEYNKVIELEANDAKAYNNRGVAYSSKQEYDKAIADYTKAIELNNNYALAYLNKGYLLKKIGINYEQAKLCLEKAKELYSIKNEKYRLEKIEENIKELDEYIEAKKQKENRFTKILKETEEIFNNSEKKKRSFLNFIIPSERTDHNNYLEILRRWNSYTPIVADNFHVSKGGGYFLKINGKGIVIDPGFNFIENFKGLNHYFDEIDIVLISHAHNDHTADIESILTLLHKYNENIKSSDNSEDTYTVEYDLVQKHGDTEWAGFDREKKKKLIDEEFERSTKRKIIDIFITASTFKKYVGMFELKKSINYNLHIIEAGYEKSFVDDKFLIKAIKAKHFDIISDDSSVGFLIEFDDNVILYTGDTGIDKNIVENYKKISKNIINKKLVLLAHLGGFKQHEVGYKESDGYKSFYKNHLGRLGLVELNNILKPRLCLISEFGEEFKDRRIELSEIMDNLYKGITKFLPADIGLRLNFDEGSCKVYGISNIEIDTLKMKKDDIDINETGICLLRKDYSLHYYSKTNNVKEGELIQVLIDEYENSNR
ncbi:MAG: tetratricopeptide repeat protein [Clostridium sp.]|nr:MULTISPECIES: tetratricopeptide repeat protein [Clostridium]MBS5306716.1 tetratricopeptide repeat protein [Clostridium sp.]MDB1944743.1 tetratricopeptide repeat protein [Clostridium tertium]MDB1952076.1 tetratricopeptide repeat protein [Clostridium tertium]MDU2459722.1 tetratricopeptide repeat protein [Clostridium sp.]MDU3407816.1 tetratricopeptide repeat protein [Clostridium sp.]